MQSGLPVTEIDVCSDRVAHEGQHLDAIDRRLRCHSIGVVVAAAATIAALWLSIALLTRAERDSTIAHAGAETATLSAAFQAEVETKLDAINRPLTFVARHMRADPAFNVHTWARDHLPLVRNVLRSIAVVGPDGTLRSTSEEAHPPPLDLSDRDWFRVAMADASPGPRVGGPWHAPLSDAPGITVSRRVDGPNGDCLGVIVASLAAEQLTVLPRDGRIGPRDILALIGSDNRILARFTAANPDGMDGAGALMAAPPEPESDGGGARTFIRAAQIDGVRRLYSSRPLEHYPLHVVVADDLDAILAPAVAHAWLIRGIGALASLMLAGLAGALVMALRQGAARERRLAAEQARLEAEGRRGHAMREQLRASEQRLRDYAVMASDWLWEQDAELRFTEIGIEAPDPARLGAFIGLRRWEGPGTRLSPEHWESHKRDLLARRPFRDFRYAIVSTDGTTHHVSVNGIPVHDAHGGFAGYRGTGRDVTAEVEAEAALRDAKNRAEQAETLLRDAVDSMSEGFLICDQDDRFVMCNEAYRRIYPEALDIFVPGTRFADILRRVIARGGNLDAIGQEEAWVAERLHQHQHGVGAMQHRVSDGRWILATDRLMKNGGVAGLRVDITELKQARDALRESEARLERAQEIAGVGSWELDVASGRYIWSKQLFRIRGLSPDTFEPTIDSVPAHVHPDDNPSIREWLDALIAGTEVDTREIRIIRPDREIRTLRVEGRAIRDDDGAVRRLTGTMQDVTERRLIERQLSHAQKMEAIGTLTGGMAHDFNNGLGVIIGNLDLLARLVAGNGTAEEVCGEAREAAVRCADLIRGLLAFARRQPLQPKPIDVNALVRDTARLLDRTLGDDIALHLTLSPELWPALADAAQLEAALVNLATNARDAMPKGGQLRIITRNTRLDAHYTALHPEAAAGDYVLVEVGDTGTGIAPDIIGRVFEPFFTTKPPGAGSGLGLAMVFGFVRQSGGHIDLASDPGLGTTFRIHLPRAQATETIDTIEQCPIIGGDETVLLVEDNAPLRQLAARQLGELGYRVLPAENAERALQIVSTVERVDLLFADVVMPGAIDGIELACLMGRLNPEPAILLTSGFPAGRAGRQSAFPVLAKPYSLEDLARAVRERLDVRVGGVMAAPDVALVPPEMV